MTPTQQPTAADLTSSLERLARQLDLHSEVTHELLTTIGQATGRRVELPAAEVATVGEQYRRLGPEHPRSYELLRLLAAAGTRESLEAFTQLVVELPPQASQAATLSFVPLFQHGEWPVEAVFPEVFAALAQGSAAAVVLDLANYLTRQGRVAKHPAADKVEMLADLLGRVVGMLGRLEEHPQDFASSPKELTERVSEALSLVVALCDALGLIGDVGVVGKLYQACELKHRRIRVEAGAALARLGESAGFDTLVEMAGEAVTRSRALAYLEELGQLDRAKPEQLTPESRAEGLLASWLAQPLRYGVGPSSIEVIDRRTQYWPGYDEPVECFLLRYEMPIGDPMIQGIGLVGPTIAADRVNLEGLTPPLVYAYYAGASIEHEAIAEVTIDKLGVERLGQWTQRKGGLQDEGFIDLQLLWQGRFFEHAWWVALGRREGQRVLLVANGETRWYPLVEQPEALSPADWYAIHKGRVMLETFNPG